MKRIFQLAHKKGARHLNRFCSSYLLQHVDNFLSDEKCFPGKGKSMFTRREAYVNWLFMAVDDRFADPSFFTVRNVMGRGSVAL